MDNEHIQAISVRLNGTNYAYWSYLMKTFLVSRDLWGYVTGDVNPPSVGIENFAKLQSEWITRNAKILSWINNAVEPSIGMHLAKFETAGEAWKYLAGIYVQSNFAKRYDLENKLRATPQGEMSIQEFYNSMTGIWDELAMMEPPELSKSDCYIKFREEQRLVQFLMALRNDFELLRGSLLHRTPRPTVNQAVSELIAEETRLKSVTFSPSSSVFMATSMGSSLNINRSVRSLDANQCRFCHEKGHWKKNCPKLKAKELNMNRGLLPTPPAKSKLHSTAFTSSTKPPELSQPTITREDIDSILAERLQQLLGVSIGNITTSASALACTTDTSIDTPSSSGTNFRQADWDRP